MVCAASPSSKIEGGFVAIPVATLMTAWRACQSGPLGIGEFRAWIACFEIKARRCLADQSRLPAYSLAEFARLLGITERRARAAIKRLVAAGLISWKTNQIEFSAGDARGVEDTIGGGHGRLAVPRRLLRWLVAGQSASVIATAVTVLLRCLSRRKSGWRGWGRLKSTFIASEFQVSLRQAKDARQRLVAIGWLVPTPTPTWSERRYGKAFAVALDWTAPDPSVGASIAPRRLDSGASIAPACLKPGTLSGSKNQEPHPGEQTGFRIAAEGKEESETARVLLEPPDSWTSATPAAPRTDPSSAPARPTGGPPRIPSTPPAVCPSHRPARIDDIQPIDLEETARTLTLFDQAAKRGLVGSSENDRLKFLALGEYARDIGRANPGGLMASLIRRKAWHFATQKQEESARRKLKAHLWATPDSTVIPVFGVVTKTSPPVRPVLSEDARMVREICRALAAAGYRGDPFPQVRRLDASWTRERWDAALAELGPIRGSQIGGQDVRSRDAAWDLTRATAGRSRSEPTSIEEPGGW